MALRGTISRSVLSTARAAVFRSAAAPHPRPPLLSGLRTRRSLPYYHPTMLRELGGAQSLLPLHSVVASSRLTSHLSVDVRACSELSQAHVKQFLCQVKRDTKTKLGQKEKVEKMGDARASDLERHKDAAFLRAVLEQLEGLADCVVHPTW